MNHYHPTNSYRCLAAWLLIVSSNATLQSQPPQVSTLEIGAAAPDFDLPGVDDRNYRLQDFADAQVLVVIFTCNHCPTAQAYEERILHLHRDYHQRGVAIVLISPNDPQAVNLSELGYTDLGDSLADMKIRAKDRGFPFPYLYDGETQATSLAYGALATPHVFIFDAARKLRYVGRIDDGEVKPPSSHDARNAIDALLAGQPVPVERTRVFGCSTKWSYKREDSQRLLERWQQEPVELSLIDAAAVKQLVAKKSEKYRLINVWATWCAPCVEELRELVDMNRMYRRRPLEVITVSLDDHEHPEAVRKVLEENYCSTTNYLYAADDKDALAAALDEEWPGPLPHTILVNPDGQIVYRHTGPFDPLTVRRTIVEHIGRTYASR